MPRKTKFENFRRKKTPNTTLKKTTPRKKQKKCTSSKLKKDLTLPYKTYAKEKKHKFEPKNPPYKNYAKKNKMQKFRRKKT